MINFNIFILEVIAQLKTNKSDLFDNNYSQKNIDGDYNWKKTSEIINSVDLGVIQHRLEDEKFNSAMGYISDIENQLNDLEEKVFDDSDDILYSIRDDLKYLKRELEGDVDFEDTKKEIEKQKDLYEKVSGLVSDMDDMIIHYKDYTDELYDQMIHILNVAINNNGIIDPLDYIHIEEKKSNQFNTLWKSFTRKDKIGKLLIDLEIDGEEIKIEKEIDNGK